MRPLVGIVLLLLSPDLLASSRNVRGLQSGDPDRGARIFHVAGIYGEGQVIGVLDTGLDWDMCFFDGPGDPPPLNTVTPDGDLQTDNVDPTRRKVIAYDLLYSCDEFPGAFGCETGTDPAGWDDQGHGTVNAGAAAGDRGPTGTWDTGDALATAAKLVIQDGSYIGGDLCASRPGFGCPLRDMRTVLGQAWEQGARIHTNSWGNRQGAAPFEPAPTGNYTVAASQIDEFVHAHREMVVIFNTGNAGAFGPTSLSSPGSAKNTIQVGAFWWNDGFPSLESYSGRGPTRDGRLKPDLVGPGRVLSALPDGDVRTGNCDVISEAGTSWAAPTIASLVALIREYFMTGHYPSGVEGLGDPITPSAALVKALLAASTRSLVFLENGVTDLPLEPAPSPDQGHGYPVAGDILPIPGGDAPKLVVLDESDLELQDGESRTLRYVADSDGEIRVALAWTDPAAAPAPESSEPVLVNDLDLSVTVNGVASPGNASLTGGSPDRLNNLETVRLTIGEGDEVVVSVVAHRLGLGPSQSAALVISGELAALTPARRRGARRR